MCNTHYLRWVRHGDVNYLKSSKGMSLDAKLKFVGWVVTDAGCWEWRGKLNASGYGLIRVGQEVTGAHRIAYRAWVGEIATGQVVRHSCDNRTCINPNHLSTGSVADNNRDMSMRDRHGTAKLTNADVAEIKSRLLTNTRQCDIARAYEVSDMTISDIARGKTWKHVTLDGDDVE